VRLLFSAARILPASARLTWLSESSEYLTGTGDIITRVIWLSELWSVQDSHFTSEKRWSKTYCSFTVAVEQYRRKSSAVLTRRIFCYQTSATVLIRAEETSRLFVWCRQQSLVWCWLVDVVVADRFGRRQSRPGSLKPPPSRRGVCCTWLTLPSTLLRMLLLFYLLF